MVEVVKKPVAAWNDNHTVRCLEYHEQGCTVKEIARYIRQPEHRVVARLMSSGMTPRYSEHRSDDTSKGRPADAEVRGNAGDRWIAIRQKYGKRLVEKNGAWYLDGEHVLLQDLLR